MNNARPDRPGRKTGDEMKKIIALATVALALAVPATSLAAGENASPSGANHGAFANVNGDFGFLGGLGGTPYYDGSLSHEVQGAWAVGQDPGATGYNNSGNPTP
jgi:hypothetical protein